MAFDPLLLVALFVGAVAGRLVRHRGVWPSRVALGTVFALLLLLGMQLGRASDRALLSALPVGVGLAALLVGLTAGAAYTLRSTKATDPFPRRPGGSFPWTGPAFAVSVIAGFGLDRGIGWELDGAIEPLLWLLVGVVAFDLRWSWGALRRWWAPLLAAGIGATGTALVGAIALALPWPVAIATAGGFGFYSLAGPLVALRFGATFGFIAFLANFLRENLLMVGSPWMGRSLRGEGLAAIGGATSMDTTLFFITRYGDPESGSLALMTGLVLTVAATILLPLAVGGSLG